MNTINASLRFAVLLAAATLVAGCNFERDPILGTGAIAPIAPVVTAVAPAADATGVPVNVGVITADFSEAVMPLTGTASFVVTCGAPCVNPTGVVTLDPTSRVASFTLGANLAPTTVYTGTITAAASVASGNTMAAPFVWTFTTGLTPDLTRPRVTVTQPATTTPGPTLGAPTNTVISAVFTEDMAPATISATSFTLTCGAPCVNPAGTVSYAVGSRTALFAPSAVLVAGTTYTATITIAATDLAGNALGGNQAALPAASAYVWTFTTATPVPPSDVTVGSTNPLGGATLVCPSASINATFNIPSGLRMDPLTVTGANFLVTGPGPGFTPVAASSVVLDGPTGTIATFTPQAALVSGTTYTATIRGGATGVKDLAIPANQMLVDHVWSFTAGPATGLCAAPSTVDMGTAAPFGIAATAGVTNTPTAPLTHINGNVVLDPNFTCNAVAVDNAGGFGLCGGSAPTINGLVITNTFPNTTDSATIKADLNSAFLSITPPAGPPAVGSLAGGTPIPAPTTMGAIAGNPMVLGDNYFTPGVWISGTSILISDDITLDALGDPNAEFFFQSASTLTTADGAVGPGVHTRILLVNGAKASNVWWQVASSATLGNFTEFNGNVLAAINITMKTGATSCGRLMAGAWVGVPGGMGQFVFDSNVVSIPGNGCPP